jgi:hypothetical protein
MRARTVIAPLALLAAAAATTAYAAKPPGKNLTISAKPNPVVFGHTTVISGKLTGQAHAGKTVRLRTDPFPFGSFSNDGTATTDAQGDYTFSQQPTVNTRYQVAQGPTESSIITVGVRIRVSIRLSDRTPEAGTRVRFHGRACPKHDGALVKIQRRTKTKRWRTVRETHTVALDANCSKYSRRVRINRDGTYRVVVVSGDADHMNGISRRRFINAHA